MGKWERERWYSESVLSWLKSGVGIRSRVWIWGFGFDEDAIAIHGQLSTVLLSTQHNTTQLVVGRFTPH